MHIAYVDESGNLGPSKTYTLGCILIAGDQWPAAFDAVIGFRRFLSRQFGLPVRAEIKATYLLRNEGPFEGLALPEGMRATIYRQAMRLHAKIGLRTFAVVIRKEELGERDANLNARSLFWRSGSVTGVVPSSLTTRAILYRLLLRVHRPSPLRFDARRHDRLPPVRALSAMTRGNLPSLRYALTAPSCRSRQPTRRTPPSWRPASPRRPLRG